MSKIPLTVSSNLDTYDYQIIIDNDTAVGEDSGVLKKKIKDAYDDFLFPISRQRSNPGTRFYSLKEEWEKDTAMLSSITEISIHPAYQQIIGMGESALPYIIREMGQRPNHWFWALKAITGEDPVPSSKRGIVSEMTNTWILWWRKNRTIYDS